MKKIINTQELQLFNDNTWADFTSLVETKTLEKTSKVLIMYNISLPGMQSHIVTRVDINTVPIEQSRSIAGDSMYWGIHNAFIYEFKADVEYTVKVRYRTPYRKHILFNICLASKANPRNNDWESQSLMVLQLPDWTNINRVRIEKGFNFNCDGNWNDFPDMNKNIEISSSQMHLFIYNVVLPLNDKKMSVAIFLDNQIQVRSYLIYFRKDRC
jgi:hypothetical protein